MERPGVSPFALFFQHILGLVYFTCEVGRAAAIWVVREHDLTVRVLELRLQRRAVSVSRPYEKSFSRRGASTTHFRPRIAMASFLSILDLKPPFTHSSAALLPALRSRVRPAKAAAMAPTPTMIGVAIKECCG